MHFISQPFIVFSVAIAVLLIAHTPIVSADKVICYHGEGIKLTDFLNLAGLVAKDKKCGKDEICYQKLDKKGMMKVECKDKKECKGKSGGEKDDCAQDGDDYKCCCSTDKCIAPKLKTKLKPEIRCYKGVTELDKFLADKDWVKTCTAKDDEVCYQKVEGDMVTLSCENEKEKCKDAGIVMSECKEDKNGKKTKCCCSGHLCVAPTIAAMAKPAIACYSGVLKLAKFLADKESVNTCTPTRGEVCSQMLEDGQVTLSCARDMECKDDGGENMKCGEDKFKKGKINCCCYKDKCVGSMIESLKEDDDDQKKASSQMLSSPLVVLLLATVALFALLTDRRRVFSSA